MNTPVQMENVLSPLSNQPGDKGDQLVNSYAAKSELRREVDGAPDYVYLIEVELKAFQKELRQIELALAAGRR